jgi:hypothetical protein
MTENEVSLSCHGNAPVGEQKYHCHLKPCTIAVGKAGLHYEKQSQKLVCFLTGFQIIQVGIESVEHEGNEVGAVLVCTFVGKVAVGRDNTCQSLCPCGWRRVGSTSGATYTTVSNI